jgi:hypothetical protein
MVGTKEDPKIQMLEKKVIDRDNKIDQLNNQIKGLQDRNA